MADLRQRFLALLERYIHKLTIRGNRATGLAPCHEDSSPSFSADLDRGVWFCHACAQGGGVRDFAKLIGEEWHAPHPLRSNRAALERKRQAEAEARAILRRRKEEQEDNLLEQHREACEAKVEAADIMGLFHRHPELAEERPELLDMVERQYSEAVDHLTLLGAQLDGEIK